MSWAGELTWTFKEKLEIISLLVAVIVLSVALYRYLLVRWRSSVDLRDYPFLRPLQSRELSGHVSIMVESPATQKVRLDLLDQQEAVLDTYVDGSLDKGTFTYSIDTTKLADGTHYLRLTSRGQKDTKRFEVLNAQV